MDKASWTLESALPVIKRIADIAAEHGFAVALYGSVLRRERSESDLDLYFVVAEARTTTVHAQTCIAAIAQSLFGIEPHMLTDSAYRLQFKDGKRIDAQFIDFTPLSLPKS